MTTTEIIDQEQTLLFLAIVVVLVLLGVDNARFPNDLRHARIGLSEQLFFAVFRENCGKIGAYMPALPLTVSNVVYKYLTYLSKNTPLGGKETDVARYLLTKQLEEMVRNKEHERLIPPEVAGDAQAEEPEAEPD